MIYKNVNPKRVWEGGLKSSENLEYDKEKTPKTRDK